MLAVLGLMASAWALASTDDPEQRFRAANDLARHGDLPKAEEGYRELRQAGAESTALYWNWAEVARARGAAGEALWALLRARERSPWDGAVVREIERTREGLNLDKAELNPEPLAALGRWSRALRLDLVALVLLLLSVGAHAAGRWRTAFGGLGRAGWALAVLGLLVAALPLGSTLARPTGVVVRREAPLLDAASPMAEVVGRLREGEVLPVLETSGDWCRVQDSSGARGWAFKDDVPLIQR